VAAVVLGDDRLRYLVCSLCGTEWHRTRVQCATCGESSGLTYLGIEDRGKAVKAEACSHCRTFLKIFYLEEDPKAEPFADDVATLALDLLVADEGYARGGVSCFWS
jgi:FdhE protein